LKNDITQIDAAMMEVVVTFVDVELLEMLTTE